jgi:hypothetical protein
MRHAPARYTPVRCMPVVVRSKQVCIEWMEATVPPSIYLRSELTLTDTRVLSARCPLADVPGSACEAPPPSPPPCHLATETRPTHNTGEVHAHEMHAHEVHAREVHAREIHVRDMLAHEVHAHEVHAHKIHAHEVHALETHAREVSAHETHAL